MRMNLLFDSSAPKKPTNVSVNSDLLSKARALRINLSATLEAALVDVINESLREQWLEQNRHAIDAYNRQVDEQGVFSDGLRSF
jgi:antitoxin CcdA